MRRVMLKCDKNVDVRAILEVIVEKYMAYVQQGHGVLVMIDLSYQK